MISGAGFHLGCVMSWLLAADAGDTDKPAEFEAVVTAPRDAAEELDEERATSSVSRRDIDRRLPRSAPDALRYEPGVFVQQSAHGQGSAFIRGLTGQQTLLLFDGIRMNNSTYRQGPNQYFFTLDPHTVRSIEVLRGGGSTRWGSDALGGVIDAHPIEPSLVRRGFGVEPKLSAKAATADSDRGGRFQTDASWATPLGVDVGFVGGLGARRVGLLKGPPVLNPDATTDIGHLPWVPRYEEYDPTLPFAEQPTLRTQLGTGFDELTGDGRFVLRLSPEQRLTLAGYLYREYNAPRTDQCPPPTAPFDQCLTYAQQFRHLAYAAWDARLGRMVDEVRATFSWQQQHERRRLDLTAANLLGRGIDDVHTWGVTARATTKHLTLSDSFGLGMELGADTYLDWVRSRAEHTYTDTLDTIHESRGQYLDRSSYVYGGAFADALLTVGPALEARAGLRPSWTAASAPGDRQSGSSPVHRTWFPVVGHAGVEWQAAEAVELLFNYDNSYRAPNLDDMTARQQTGPGFQFENPRLRPERANTFELGGRIRTRRFVADLWVFETLLAGNIIKVSKAVEDCPVNTPQCQSSWSRFKLENAPTVSEIRGTEISMKLWLPARVSVRATTAYAWSEGPRVGGLAYGSDGVTLGDRVPLSRTPPLHGTAELGWRHTSGFSAGAALQWAAAQRRLAIADYADGRIPKYGTPGFAVLHLRAGYRLGTELVVAVVLENVFDSPYRFHGSSVNGAGRGLIVQLEAAHAFSGRDDPQGEENP